MAGRSGAMKLVKRPQAADVQAAAAWGVAAFTTAVWIVQPFDWVKKTFFQKPEPEN